MTDFEAQLRRNATYWSEDGEGTAGYLLSEEQFKAILAAFEAAVAEIIGSDEPDPTQVTHSDDGSTTITLPTGELDRNELRAEQRARAKLPEEKS